MLELCPHCQIPTVDQVCPRCGYQPSRHNEGAQSEASSSDFQQPIQFDVQVTSSPPASEKRLDWRSELRKKLDERAEKTKGTATPSVGESENPDPGAPPSLFKYKLDRALSKRPAAPTFRRNQTVFEEPLARRKPVRPLPQPPGQKTLRLKPFPPVTDKGDEVEKAEPIEIEGRRISKEVLFSRFLSGIVDLFLPALQGIAFAVAASVFIGFDFFAPTSMKWIGLLAISFFFFNSLFFLLSSGQTPGMIMTDLRLVSEEEDTDISMVAVLSRVLLFIPSTVTVIGLGWAIFDPLCRCLHDILSRTRIEPGG